MPAIFISHSSHDRDISNRIKAEHMSGILSLSPELRAGSIVGAQDRKGRPDVRLGAKARLRFEPVLVAPSIGRR
jgi:hypothetical protein